MMPRKIWFVFVLTILLRVSPIWAAGSPWQAWLYEGEVGRMTLVNENGLMLRQFILPVTSGSEFSYNAAVSPDGRYVAYVGTVYPAAGSPSVMLYLYDLTLNTVIYNYGLPSDANHSLGFSSTVFNFSANSSTFAMGYASSSLNWEVLYIDLTTYVLSSLRADAPASVAAGIDTGFGFLVPTVQSNRDGQVKFTMIPSGTEGAPLYSSFTWTPATGMVAANDAYVMLNTDTLPLTGEVIMTLSDPRFPNSESAETGFPISNTLQVYDPATNSRYPVYASPTDNVYWPRFIQGGERIVVLGYNTLADRTTWQIFERSGNLSGVVDASAPASNVTSVAGLLNGFLYTAGGFDAGSGTTLYSVETRLTGSPYVAVPVWNSVLGARARIVWVSDNQAFGNTPFTPWGRAMPTGEADSGELLVNDQALVQTTEGDSLNVRSGPGTTFSRVSQLSNGALVTLIEGPRSGEGFVWWRVRTSSGMEGWVVEEADGVRTLIPAFIGPPVELPSLLPAPILLLPANGTVYNVFPRTTTLVWTPVENATVYLIEIESCLPGTVPLACEPLITTSVTSSQTSYTFSFVGAQPGRWRVWAMDVSSQEGAKSDWWTFTHQQ